MSRRVLIVLVLLASSLLTPLGLASPASAAPRVTVTNSQGKAVADPTYATTVTVSGKGFQSIKNGYGGIYVLFGTVTSGWQPSKGGQTGRDYYYVPDSETKDNQGFQKFVAFPGSDTADAANGGLIKADGTWRTTMTIPGATFQTLDRTGKATTVDCRKVTCGVITIGAHGVANARNETFTPITFASLGAGSAPSSTPSAAPTGGSSAPSAPTSVSTLPSVPVVQAPTGPAAITVDRATAVAGHVLTFIATGFKPGEQVVVSFDDGVAALGPLSAGASGEVAGALQLPADVGGGTHTLKILGAASAAAPTVNFAVANDAAPAAAQVEPGRRTWPAYVFLGVALVVLVAAAGFLLWRRYAVSRMRRGAVDVH